MSAHTPGPWEVVKDNMLDYAVLGRIAGERVIVAYQLDEGDARLIAAAPALLEALEGIIEIGKRDMSNPKYDGYFESARAVIAQVREVPR